MRFTGHQIISFSFFYLFGQDEQDKASLEASPVQILLDIFYFDRINWIFWIIFLSLNFPEKIPNEQSAAPKRETFEKRGRYPFLRNKGDATLGINNINGDATLFYSTLKHDQFDHPALSQNSP
ncbi:MAG: hypothetical protein J7J70_04645, partial [Deltaproteobacteria bacterium]|nr:hypothetical protein [Candidatus Tharpellaceae bacterium]